MASSCPVPYFGELRRSKVASLGINPSNREFLDAAGRELDGADRRFPTLRSLGLPHWGEASSLDVNEVVAACDGYFSGNPYDRWFGVLDAVLAETGSSYYSSDRPAAHLDLVPYATHSKWGDLRAEQQRALLDSGADLLGALLRESAVEMLVLNGRTVVGEFENVTGVRLASEAHSAWDLSRRATRSVRGHGYIGEIDRFGNVELGRCISIVGFNHNLQSSFGMTRRVLIAIREWIGSRAL